MNIKSVIGVSAAVLAVAVTVLRFPSAGSHGPARPPQEQPMPVPPALPRRDEPVGARAIVCWGDSLTEGVGASEARVRLGGEDYDVSYLSYPEILERLTGLTTYNYGISGATSGEIAFIQGGLGEGVAFDLSGLEPSFSTDRDQLATGDVLILEIGSNGGWNGDYQELIDQYQAMIDHSGCEEYLVIGDTDDPGTSIGDLAQQPFEAGTGVGETAWEAALRSAFGERFINMRAFLVEHGLETVGLEPTEEDASDADTGCVSRQLRADWTHLNSYGYCAEAVAICERGRELGFWS